MKQAFFGTLAVVILALATFLIAEGTYSVTRWDAAAHSVTYRVWRLIVRNPDQHLQVGNLNGTPPSGEELPFARQVGRKELDLLIPKFKAARIGLGNSPYTELRTEDAAVNMYVDGCRTQKSHIHKTMLQLRSHAFEPLDPPNMFFDADSDLDREIKEFIAAYGFRQIRHTTNEHGERVTLPIVASDHKVFIAGSSQAVGTMVDDTETISSQLQALDRSRQYINLGIGGANAADTFCALEKAAKRYHGQIDELIYVYSESNFRSGGDYRSPAELLGWLKKFQQSEGIRKVTVVLSPKIYNIVPQITRFRGYAGERSETFARSSAEVAEIAVAAGFGFINITDIALAEVSRTGTQFSALSVFVDHGHLSPYGTTRLVERLMHD